MCHHGIIVLRTRPRRRSGVHVIHALQRALETTVGISRSRRCWIQSGALSAEEKARRLWTEGSFVFAQGAAGTRVGLANGMAAHSKRDGRDSAEQT